MHLICPTCQGTVELADANLPAEVVCPSCGSSFPLNTCSTVVWRPLDGPRRVGRFEVLDQVGAGQDRDAARTARCRSGGIVAVGPRPRSAAGFRLHSAH